MKFTEKYNLISEYIDELRLNQLKASREMSIAYSYKENLIEKMTMADKDIKDKQKVMFDNSMKLQTEIARLKIEFDLYVNVLSKI